MEGSNSKERIHRELREQLAQALGIPAEFLVLPYDKTKDLAKRLGCSVGDILPMSEDNDPFYVASLPRYGKLSSSKLSQNSLN